MATPSKMEWDEAREQWIPATGRPGASFIQWNGVSWDEGKNPEGPGAFRRGLETGWESTKGLAFDVLPAMIQSAFGYEEASQRNLDAYKKRMDELQAKGLLARTTYQDVQDVSSLGSYVGEAVGEAIPSLATSLLGGLGIGAAATRLGAGKMLTQQVAKRAAALEAEAAATGTTLGREAAIKAATSEVSRNVGIAAGAFGGSALQNIPESFASLAEEGQQSLGAAFVVGSLKSALDALGPVRLLSKTRGTDFSDKLTDVLSARLLKGRPGAAGALGGTLETVALEGLTEGTQQLLDETAKVILADKSVDWTQVIDAALKGGIGAAPAGGVAGALGARSKAAAEETRAKQIDEYQQKLAAERELAEKGRLAAAEREKWERERAEAEQDYINKRMTGEIEVPPRERADIDYFKDALREVEQATGIRVTMRTRKDKEGNVLVEKADLLPMGIRKGDQVIQKDSTGAPVLQVNQEDVMRRAQELAQQKVIDPSTGKPFTVASARNALQKAAIFEVQRTAQRMRSDDQAEKDGEYALKFFGQTSAENVATQGPTQLQGREYQLQKARQLVDEVRADPESLDLVPGLRQQFEQAQALLEEKRWGDYDARMEAQKQERAEERELGPLVGKPFTGSGALTVERETPQITPEQRDALLDAGYRLDQIAQMPPERAQAILMDRQQEEVAAPQIGQQQRLALEGVLGRVQRGEQVSIPAVQQALGETGLDLTPAQTRQVLQAYAPERATTRGIGMQVVDPAYRLEERDGTFFKAKRGETKEPYVAPEVEEQPRRGVERRPADLPTESTQTSRPITEVQGGLQNPPAGYDRRDFAVLHNAIVRRGSSKILTRNDLETVAQREFDSPREVASVWEGLVKSGAVRKEGLGYRVLKDAPVISEFQAEDVGTTTTKKPTEVAEEPSKYTPPKTKVSREKKPEATRKPESKTFPADSLNESKIFKTWDDLQKHIDSGMDIIVYRGVRWNVDPDESDPRKMAKRETTQYGYFWSPSYPVASQYSRGLGQAFGERVNDGEVYAMRIPAKTMAEAVRTEQEIPLQQIKRLTALRQNILADEGIEFVIPPRLHGKRIKLSADLDFSELNKAVRKLENAEPVTSKIEPISSKLRYDLFNEGLTSSQISELTETEAREYLRNAQKTSPKTPGPSKIGRTVVPDDAPPEIRKNVEAAQNMMDRQEKINDANPDDYSCR